MFDSNNQRLEPRPVPRTAPDGTSTDRFARRREAIDRTIDDLLSSPPPPRTARSDLATYDVFGQTLIATFIAPSLSGPDAEHLALELVERLGAGLNGRGTGARHIVLDLQNVEFMDSRCIGVLVELLTRLQSGDGRGRIALANAAHTVEYLFKLTSLDRLFPICRDVMRAIEVVERDTP